MQSAALAPPPRRNASRAIANPPGDRPDYEVPSTSLGVLFELRTEAAPRRSLMRYITGWAQADPVMIAAAAIDGYRFHDPLVGTFSGKRLSRYFEFLHAQFDADGARAKPAFYLHGPMDGCAPNEWAFFREAPQLGLTGIALILIGPRGVLAETVAYDLSMATAVLRSPLIDATK